MIPFWPRDEQGARPFALGSLPERERLRGAIRELGRELYRKAAPESSDDDEAAIAGACFAAASAFLVAWHRAAEPAALADAIAIFQARAVPALVAGENDDEAFAIIAASAIRSASHVMRAWSASPYVSGLGDGHAGLSQPSWLKPFYRGEVAELLSDAEANARQRRAEAAADRAARSVRPERTVAPSARPTRWLQRPRR